VPLYAAPFSTPHSAAHSADSAGTFCNQEPVAEVRCHDGGILTAHFYVRDLRLFSKLYTAPPQREWQGLTDEEIEKLFIWQEWSEDFAEYEPVARAIEAKLKEKNT
jgi:hypothetical protein